MKKEDFFTRGAANAGIKIPLIDPRTGKETTYWLHIIGCESDAYRKEQIDSQRRIFDRLRDKIAPGNDTGLAEELVKAEEEERLRVRASLVIGWNLDEEFSREGVVRLLEEAPKLSQQIQEAADRARTFFEGVSINSPGTPKPSSDSTSDLTAASKPSEPT